MGTLICVNESVYSIMNIANTRIRSISDSPITLLNRLGSIVFFQRKFLVGRHIPQALSAISLHRFLPPTKCSLICQATQFYPMPSSLSTPTQLGDQNWSIDQTFYQIVTQIFSGNKMHRQRGFRVISFSGKTVIGSFLVDSLYTDKQTLEM